MKSPAAAAAPTSRQSRKPLRVHDPGILGKAPKSIDLLEIPAGRKKKKKKKKVFGQSRGRHNPSRTIDATRAPNTFQRRRSPPLLKVQTRRFSDYRQGLAGLSNSRNQFPSVPPHSPAIPFKLPKPSLNFPIRRPPRFFPPQILPS